MAQSLELLLDTIRSKTKKINSERLTLLQENLRLQQSLQSKELESKRLRKKVATLQSEIETLKLAKAYGQKEELDGDSKSRINEMVKEIDRCIAMLND